MADGLGIAIGIAIGLKTTVTTTVDLNWGGQSKDIQRLGMSEKTWLYQQKTWGDRQLEWCLRLWMVTHCPFDIQNGCATWSKQRTCQTFDLFSYMKVSFPIMTYDLRGHVSCAQKWLINLNDGFRPMDSDIPQYYIYIYIYILQYYYYVLLLCILVNIIPELIINQQGLATTAPMVFCHALYRMYWGSWLMIERRGGTHQYVYTYIRIYVYTYIRIYVYIMYILCIYVHMYICIYVYMYICIYVYVYICIYIYTHMYICIHM